MSEKIDRHWFTLFTDGNGAIHRTLRIGVNLCAFPFDFAQGRLWFVVVYFAVFSVSHSAPLRACPEEFEGAGLCGFKNLCKPVNSVSEIVFSRLFCYKFRIGLAIFLLIYIFVGSAGIKTRQNLFVCVLKSLNAEKSL